MIDFETMFFTLLIFSGANSLVSVLSMFVMLKAIGEIRSGDCKSTWNTIEKCEVFFVAEEEDHRKVKPC